MPENEVPIEIERFLDRGYYSCSEQGFVRSRQSALVEMVNRMADAYENGGAHLRTAALRRLSDADARMVDHALSCLFVVGTAGDVSRVEPLCSHPDEAVRKAARTCLFELRRRSE